MTDLQWSAMSNLGFLSPKGANQIQVDTAWALLRFFRTGEGWKSQEEKRQWAKEEYAAFLERERKKPTKPRLV